MSKFTVKTNLSNIKKEGDEFTYDQEIVSIKWNEYDDRKQYQMGYGNESVHFPNYVTDKKRWRDTQDKFLLHPMDPDFGPDQLKDIEEN